MKYVFVKAGLSSNGPTKPTIVLVRVEYLELKAMVPKTKKKT